ncbi:hypothetical protein [Nonomuraea sp. NPDC049750]|uniref:hypothetical protein n=1 Tax=Nonomuraea sp. NPDC049750 TaxID=3154738 RepID=UPI0033D8ACEF
MSSAEQAPPEGALIRLARKARGLSVKKAVELVRERAPDIRLGESRWYHIEGGTEGKDKVVIAPEDTLAHMAYVVGLTSDRLEQVGRADAAEVLQEIFRQERAKTAPAQEPADPQLRRLLELWPQARETQRRAIVGVLKEMISESPESIGKPDQGQERRTG